MTNEEVSLSFLRELLSNQDIEYSAQDIEKAKRLLSDPFISDYSLNGILLRYSEGAERVLRRIIKEDPDDINNCYNLANLLDTIGRHQEAEELYQRMVEKDDDPLSHIDYSHFLERHGRYAEAEAQIREALRKDSQNPDTWMEYGGSLESWGKWGKAKKAYKTALAHIPIGNEFRKTLKQKIKKQRLRGPLEE